MPSGYVHFARAPVANSIVSTLDGIRVVSSSESGVMFEGLRHRHSDASARYHRNYRGKWSGGGRILVSLSVRWLISDYLSLAVSCDVDPCMIF